MVLALSLAGLLGCATPRPAASSRPFHLLVFGDHGYDLNYLSPGELKPVRTLEEAIANERAKWIGDKRPPAEFTPSVLVKAPATGGYVPASGMMPVSKAMLDYCRTTGCDAAVMLGDNIYPNGATGGADGRDDAKRFDDILLAPFRNYGTLGNDFRIYAALGNHDWRTSREAALSEVRYLATTPPFYMDGIAYRVKPAAGKGDVEIFVLDTEILLAGTTVYDDRLDDNGRELPPGEPEVPKPWILPHTDAERGMAAWLDASLRESTARWKIVIGHHPLWSSAGGKFEQAKAMRRLILASLCRYADMFLAGHEHTLEVHTDDCSKAVPGSRLPAFPQIVSGAAAKHRPLNSWFVADQASRYPELSTTFAKGMTWGYVHLTLNADDVVVRAITTPNDGSGRNVVEHTQTIARRSGNATK
jgi:hypothetical protein